MDNFRQTLKVKVQDILQYLDEYLHPIVSPEHWSVYSELYDMVSMLLSAQPEIITCEHCEHGIHSGRGPTYYCIVSPEELGIHKYDFWCAYAERRKDE